MSKSTVAAILAFLAAVVGALTACALYLRRREKELDEYEQLLFSDEPDEDADEEDYEDEDAGAIEYADISEAAQSVDEDDVDPE